MSWGQEGQCPTCGRSLHHSGRGPGGTFFHYTKFPGCDPHRPLPKFDPPHGGYPGP